MTPQARDNALEFDQEQTALLELLAAQIEGVEDGFNTYGYADVNSQANGFFPGDSFNFADTYSSIAFNGCQQDQRGENAAFTASFTTGPAGDENTREDGLEITPNFDIASFASELENVEHSTEGGLENTPELELALFAAGNPGYEHTPETNSVKTPDFEATQPVQSLPGADTEKTCEFEIGHLSNGSSPEPESASTSHVQIAQHPEGPILNEYQLKSVELTLASTPQAIATSRPQAEIQHLASYGGSVVNSIDVDDLDGEDEVPNGVPAEPNKAVVSLGKGATIQEKMKSFEQSGFFVRSFVPEASPKRLREASTFLQSLEKSEASGHKRQKTTSPSKSPAASNHLGRGISKDRDGGLQSQPSSATPNILRSTSRMLSHKRSEQSPAASAHLERGLSKDRDGGLQSQPGSATPEPRYNTPHMVPHKEPEKSPKKDHGKDRRSSRPAVSKMFKSLELHPEAFLYVQAAVKDFMLDPEHPDRMNCVGKKKYETDAIKLKMYTTAKYFLKNEGWGVRCFGSEADDFATRNLRWPEHEIKIIEYLTPLMRRMVTNERQRRYAAQKRIASMGPDSGTPTPQPDDDEDLVFDDSIFDNYNPSLASSASTVDGQSPPKLQLTFENNPGKRVEPDEPEVRYHVNIMKDGRRLQPKVVLTPDTCLGFPSFSQHVSSCIQESGQQIKSIQILGPGGLLEVKDEVIWTVAIESIKRSEWMDGDVKCVVEVEGGV